MFVPARSAAPSGARQRLRPIAEIGGVEASWRSLRRSGHSRTHAIQQRDARANRLRPFREAAEGIMSPPEKSEEGRAMPDIKGIAHFSIPVIDVDRSTKFYTEIVG